MLELEERDRQLALAAKLGQSLVYAVPPRIGSLLPIMPELRRANGSTRVRGAEQVQDRGLAETTRHDGGERSADIVRGG